MTRRDTRGEAADTISRKVARKQAAERKDPHRTVWFGFGMFGLVGWAVAVPTLIGVALGLWLDRIAAGDFSWTLALLLGGVAVGCINAWYWVSKEGHDDR
jgi:ATP synthase protein I